MIDLAVGVIIGGAFNALVTSLVNDIIIPILSLLTGKLISQTFCIALDGNHYDTLAAAQELGVATVNYGTFISGLLILLSWLLWFPSCERNEQTCRPWQEAS